MPTRCATPSPGTETRDLPLVAAALPILSKAYYATREFDQTTLDPPLGSGPYRLADFKQGAFVSYKRRDDYWAKDLPVNRGRFNFDELRFEYYRDRTAALESFKAGAFDLREEFTARDWATGYDIPAVKEGRLILLTLPDESPSGAQGFFLNTRRPKLADIRVRKALDYAFDFEWTNKNIFYDLYTRTESFFENSDMKASGKPSPAELALLEPFRGQLPAEVFDEAYKSPVSDGSGQDRKLLREAGRLLGEAGWQVKDGKRVNAKGEVLELEFLITDPATERILAAYVKNLQAIGVQTTIRRIDPAQYERRVKSFDFDVVTTRYVAAPDAGRRGQDLLGQRGGQDRRQLQSRRHERPRHRCPDRQGDGGQQPGGAEDRHPRARPRAARRSLLGATLVPAVPLRRLLGQVRPACRETALRARHYPYLVVRCRKGGKAQGQLTWSGQAPSDDHLSSEARSSHHPDPVRDHADQLRHRAVRSRRADRAGHRADLRHGRVRHRPHRRRPGRRALPLRIRRNPARAAARTRRSTAARRAWTPSSSSSSRSSSASTSRRTSASS